MKYLYRFCAALTLLVLVRTTKKIKHGWPSKLLSTNKHTEMHRSCSRSSCSLFLCFSCAFSALMISPTEPLLFTLCCILDQIHPEDTFTGMQNLFKWFQQEYEIGYFKAQAKLQPVFNGDALKKNKHKHVEVERSLWWKISCFSVWSPAF